MWLVLVFMEGIVMEEKEYREKIIEMVNKIKSVKVLKYIFIVVNDIFLKEKIDE